MDQANIHSANDWEHAEMGDDTRKNKFLRLMGAKKKEHKGKIVIGDETNIHQHTRTDEEFKEIDKNLESAYNCGMEHDPRSATNVGHKGVGFSGDNKTEESKKEEEEEEEPLDVKSANKWEKANLGDTGRKNKFLRLMGASKKEHTGKFVIGDKEEESKKRKIRPEKDLESDLEKQYNQGLELRLSGAARRHKGLGFQEEPLEPKSEENTEKKEEASGVKSDDQPEKEDQTERDRDHRTYDNRYSRMENRDNYNYRNYDNRGDRRHDYRDRSHDRRQLDDRSYDRNRSRRHESRWKNGSDGSNSSSNKEAGHQAEMQPQQHQQHVQGNVQYNNPALGQNTGGYNQYPGQGNVNQQPLTGYNQANFTQPSPGNNQPAGYPNQTSGSAQSTSVGNYLPPEILNQPPPPPPPPQPVESSTGGANSLQSSGYNVAPRQNIYQTAVTGQSQQAIGHQAQQATTQSSQSYQQSSYFQKPTMSFVKSSDS